MNRHKLWLSMMMIGCLLMTSSAFAWVKGIYITQTTLEDTKLITSLAERAQAAGLTSFVIDIEAPSKRYQRNLEIIRKHKLQYVARVVVFPKGGERAQIRSQAHWDKKLKLVKLALAYGADAIQLDYIRYSSKQPASEKNAEDIHDVIKYFRKQIPANIPLQLDVFGIASYKPSPHIGQDLQLFSKSVSAFVPMMYPSHYYPVDYHSERPYETITGSMSKLEKQFEGKIPSNVHIYVFIEVWNYKYKYTGKKQLDYIHDEIRAVQDSKANGWYAWSANNRYNSLFTVLKEYKVR